MDYGFLWHDRLAELQADGAAQKQMAAALGVHVESHEDFAIRRVHLAAAQCRATGKVPTRANFIKMAGLSRAVQTEKVMAVVDAVYGVLLNAGIEGRIGQVSASG